MDRVATSIATPLGVLASFSTIVMMLAISADVVYRNIQGRSIPGVLELSESTLVATVFFGMAYAGTSGSHIAVDLLVSRMSRTLARWTMVLAWLLSTLILGWLTFASTKRALTSLERGEVRMGLANWPLWPARWIIVLGFASFLIVAVANVIRLIRDQLPLGESKEI